MFDKKTKSLRQKSWKAFSFFAKEEFDFRTSQEIKKVKEYYVSGIKPTMSEEDVRFAVRRQLRPGYLDLYIKPKEIPDRPDLNDYIDNHPDLEVLKERAIKRYGFWVNLLCENDLSVEKFQFWKEGWIGLEEDTEQNRFWEGCFSSFLKLHSQGHVYFGENSIYHGMDSEIYEVFYKGLLRNDEDFTIDNFLEVKVRGTLKYLEANTCNSKYEQAWRAIEFWEHYIKLVPVDSKLPENPELEELHQLFANVEFALQYPDKVHPKKLSMCERIRKSLRNDAINPVFEEIYNDCAQEGMEGLLDKGVGGELTLCLRFASEEQLQARLQALNPKTRPPYHLGHPEGTLLHLGRAFRSLENPLPGKLVNMWKYSPIWNVVDQPDKRTLVIQCTLSTSYSGEMMEAFSTANDVSLLAEYLYSKKSPTGGFWHQYEPDQQYAQLVAFLQPIDREGRFVHAAREGGELMGGLPVHYLWPKDWPDINDVVLSSGEPKVFLPKLIDELLPIAEAAGEELSVLIEKYYITTYKSELDQSAALLALGVAGRKSFRKLSTGTKSKGKKK